MQKKIELLMSQIDRAKKANLLEKAKFAEMAVQTAAEIIAETIAEQNQRMAVMTDTINGIIMFMDTVTKAELIEMGQKGIADQLAECSKNMGGQH